MIHNEKTCLLRIVDDAGTIFQQKNEYIYIPDMGGYANR